MTREGLIQRFFSLRKIRDVFPAVGIRRFGDGA
jgi:hypothetical protein